MASAIFTIQPSLLRDLSGLCSELRLRSCSAIVTVGACLPPQAHRKSGTVKTVRAPNSVRRKRSWALLGLLIITVLVGGVVGDILGGKHHGATKRYVTL
jgi:hypothetical protein